MKQECLSIWLYQLDVQLLFGRVTLEDKAGCRRDEDTPGQAREGNGYGGRS